MSDWIKRFLPFVSLVVLCILIAVVTQVIGDNQARAFSLVGTLAIIRFRTEYSMSLEITCRVPHVRRRRSRPRRPTD